jgi:hypothetical protein
MDYVNIVVHVFQKHIREYYNIEGLWGDAKITTIENKYLIPTQKMANEKPKQNNFKFTPYWIYGLLIVIFFIIRIFSGGSSFQEVGKLTSSKFNNIWKKEKLKKLLLQ